VSQSSLAKRVSLSIVTENDRTPRASGQLIEIDKQSIDGKPIAETPIKQRKKASEKPMWTFNSQRPDEKLLITIESSPNTADEDNFIWTRSGLVAHKVKHYPIEYNL
jgi:hypothetical protein